MTFKEYLNRQFDEIIDRLIKLGGKIENCNLPTQSKITYNTKEAAKLMGVSTRQLYSYRRERLIVFYKIGRKIIYTKPDVDAFFENYKVKTSNPKSKPNEKH